MAQYAPDDCAPADSGTTLSIRMRSLAGSDASMMMFHCQSPP